MRAESRLPADLKELAIIVTARRWTAQFEWYAHSRFALEAGVPAGTIVVHGNNKSDQELEAAAAAEALVVLDVLDEVERAAAAGVRRVLARVTSGIEADTH